MIGPCGRHIHCHRCGLCLLEESKRPPSMRAKICLGCTRQSMVKVQLHTREKKQRLR